MHFVNILTYKYPFYIIILFLFQNKHNMQENARHTTHLFLYFFVYFASFHSKNEGVSSYYKCSTLAQKNRPVFIQKYKAIFLLYFFIFTFRL